MDLAFSLGRFESLRGVFLWGPDGESSQWKSAMGGKEKCARIALGLGLLVEGS